MTVQLNHTIVWSRDKERSARLVAEILGRPEPVSFYHFRVVTLDNGVSLDFLDKDGDIAPQHYAFLIGEADFDGIFARVRERNLPYWADPGRTRPQQINHNDGGRGFYFAGPDEHFLEVLTRPYGGG